MTDAGRAVAILTLAALAVWWLTTPRPPTSPVLAATAPGASNYPAIPNSSPPAATAALAAGALALP